MTARADEIRLHIIDRIGVPFAAVRGERFQIVGFHVPLQIAEHDIIHHVVPSADGHGRRAAVSLGRRSGVAYIGSRVDARIADGLYQVDAVVDRIVRRRLHPCRRGIGLAAFLRRFYAPVVQFFRDMVGQIQMRDVVFIGRALRYRQIDFRPHRPC